MNDEREQYILREFEVWKEKYEIHFEQEFNVKALLGLRHQFLTTPDEYVKSKIDLLQAMQRLQYDLKLKIRNESTKEEGTKKVTINVNVTGNTSAEDFINTIKKSMKKHGVITE